MKEEDEVNRILKDKGFSIRLVRRPWDEVMTWHHKVERLVKPNETFWDKLQRRRGKCTGMWYIVLRHYFKVDSKQISVITMVEEPPNHFRISVWGIGTIKRPLRIPWCERDFKCSLQEIKARHRLTVSLIKKRVFKGFEEARK